MQNYKTVEEMAIEWNVSPRHIQNLCKNNKIEGAIKRVGAWFIPVNASNPLKNTKSDTIHFKFIGTKKKIFDSAIELFSKNGFDNISINDITKAAGIRQSSLYNHFKSKQEILDTIYDFFSYHYLKNRPSISDLEPILQEGSLLDIIYCLKYEFDEEYVQRMLDITKLIYQRIAIDESAREITKSLMLEEGIHFVEAVFNKAVQIGRIAPFDTHAMAIFINSTRLFVLHNWIIDPSVENMSEGVKQELNQYQYAAKLLTDLRDSG